jgi:hypothetical protein
MNVCIDDIPEIEGGVDPLDILLAAESEAEWADLAAICEESGAFEAEKDAFEAMFD